MYRNSPPPILSPWLPSLRNKRRNSWIAKRKQLQLPLVWVEKCLWVLSIDAPRIKAMPNNINYRRLYKQAQQLLNKRIKLRLLYKQRNFFLSTDDSSLTDVAMRLQLISAKHACVLPAAASYGQSIKLVEYGWWIMELTTTRKTELTTKNDTWRQTT